jgi:hypothetical protein
MSLFSSRVRRDRTFFASTWAEPGIRRLRERVWREGGGRHTIDGIVQSGRVWVAEFDRPDLKPQSNYAAATEITGAEQLTIIDACLEAIRSCERFVLLDKGDYGTTLRAPAGGLSASSFLELELYQAVSLQKPTTLIALGDKGRMSALVRMLEAMMPGHADIVEVRDLSEAHDLILEVAMGGRRRAPGAAAGRRGTAALAEARHSNRLDSRLYEEPLFLDGRPAGDIPPAVDVDVAEKYLHDAEAQMATDRVLSRVWIAMRALMGAHFSETTDPRIVDLWDRALERWSYAAAWRGLHGHLMLGMLTASAAQAHLRMRLDRPLFERNEARAHDLHNDLASAYYSIAGRAPRNWRRAFFERAEWYVRLGFVERPRDEHWRLLPLRGSIERRLGRTSDARITFQEALRLAEAAGNSAGVALMKSELAETDVRSGRPRRARKLIEEALNILPDDCPPGERARVMRKAIYVNFIALRGLRARILAKQLVQHATTHQTFDQLNSFVRTLARF